MSFDATDIPAPVPHLPRNIQTRRLIENLAPITTTAHDILTQTSLALGMHWGGYKPS